MSDNEKTSVGQVCWRDLTVENAVEVRDFYSAVTGWTASPQSMGEYDDYNMTMPGTGERVPASVMREAPTPACRRSGSSTSRSRMSRKAQPVAANSAAR